MTTFTPDDVSRIVRAVLARVRESHGPAAGPGPSRPQLPPASNAATGLTLPDKVVTAAVLARVPAGTRAVSLRHDAVITPSARDLAREQGLDLVRGSKGAKTTAAPARPFVVGTADCPGDAQARAASVVRSVPGSTRIPATGLGDVVAALALGVTRDGARGLLLAGRPHAAAALANRSPGVRAVTARDSASLLAAIGECAANIVVVHPRDFSATSLDRVAVALATAAAPVPAEFSPGPVGGCGCGSASPTACACSSHAH